MIPTKFKFEENLASGFGEEAENVIVDTDKDSICCEQLSELKMPGACFSLNKNKSFPQPLGVVSYNNNTILKSRLE